jgi:hypothetical protein
VKKNEMVVGEEGLKFFLWKQRRKKKAKIFQMVQIVSPM